MTSKSVQFVPNFVPKELFKDCPQCFAAHTRAKSNYCSDECQTKASNYRRMVRTCLVRFSIAGFIISFTDGVLLTVQLPDYMKPYYPKLAHTFNPTNVTYHQTERKSCVNIWDDMVRILGATVTDLIATTNMKNGEKVQDYRNELALILQDKMFLQQNIFICPECGRKFFDAWLTKWPHEQICDDCHAIKIPF